MAQKKEIIKIYQDTKTITTFDEGRRRYAYQKYKHRIESEFLKKTLNSISDKKIKILDVACGTGRMLPEVFSINKEISYVGLDTSKEMTSHLIKKANQLGIKKNVKIKIGDASKMPFKDDSFDLVFSYHLLWHLPVKDQEKIIKEMVRVCKKDGFVVFDFLNRGFFWESLKKTRTEGIYKLSLKEVKKMIGKENFDIEKLNDFPVKKDFLYKLLNVFNKLRKLLPSSMYHMLFIRVKK